MQPSGRIEPPRKGPYARCWLQSKCLCFSCLRRIPKCQQDVDDPFVPASNSLLQCTPAHPFLAPASTSFCARPRSPPPATRSSGASLSNSAHTYCLDGKGLEKHSSARSGTPRRALRLAIGHPLVFSLPLRMETLTCGRGSVLEHLTSCCPCSCPSPSRVRKPQDLWRLIFPPTPATKQNQKLQQRGQESIAAQGRPSPSQLTPTENEKRNYSNTATASPRPGTAVQAGGDVTKPKNGTVE